MERALVKLAAWSSGLLLVLAVSGDVIAEATSTDAAEISASVESFHRALARGDRTAALTLLAPDAVILESGHSDRNCRSDFDRRSRNQRERGKFSSRSGSWRSHRCTDSARAGRSYSRKWPFADADGIRTRTLELRHRVRPCDNHRPFALDDST